MCQALIEFGFVNEKQNMPEKRISKKRLKDFNEIYKQFDPKEAEKQAQKLEQELESIAD